MFIIIIFFSISEYFFSNDHFLTNSHFLLEDSSANIFPVMKRNQCDKCGKVYKSYDGLKSHKRYYCGLKPKFQCPYCFKMFYQLVHMRSHVVSVHKIFDYEQQK